MTKKIRIAILSSGVHLEILNRISMRKAGLRGAYAYLRGDHDANYTPVNSIWIDGGTSIGEISNLLHCGLEAMNISIDSIRGYQFEASLGANCTFTGIMRGGDNPIQKLNEEAIASFGYAWIAQRWAIDASDYVVRIVPISSTRNFLITCTARHTFDELKMFCESAGLRFRKCQPAVVDTLISTYERQIQKVVNSTHHNMKLNVLVETSPQPISSIIQVVLVNNGHPTDIHRFWSISSDVEELQAIAKRIVVQYGYTEHFDLKVQHWPANLKCGVQV